MTPEEAEDHEPQVVLVDENNDVKESMTLEMTEKAPDLPDDVPEDVLIA
jgi:aspartate 1-decarboxylase